MKLIDKDAVVAEIKGRIRANELYLSIPKNNEVRFQKVGAYSVLNDLLHFLDTLEVKEVDIEKEIDKEIKEEMNNLCKLGCYMEELLKGDSEGVYPLPDEVNNELFKFAKHFYKLGLRTKENKL